MELRKQLRPHSVNLERLEGRAINEATIHSALVFFACYFFLLFLGTLIVSTDGFDLLSTFTGVISCLSNIGPGLDMTGPMGSYVMFSPLSKIVMSLCMLLGRLEIFPILMLFSPRVWKN
jgi:trk system potassium uptake protein TrkH